MSRRAPSTVCRTPTGFTLLEVLISMFLLVVISFATYQATTETFKLRDVLSTEGEFYNGIRMAIGIFQRDLENAYNPIVIRPELQRPVDGQLTGVDGVSEPVSPPAGYGIGPELVQSEFFSSQRDRFGIRATRLDGRENRLSWVSSANQRMYRDSRESEFLKIRYLLESDTDTSSPPGSSMLVRVVSPDVFIYDEDRDQSIKRYPLLHGVQKLALRYYRKDKDQWSTTWDSEGADTREILPDLVELTIEVAAAKGLSYTGQYLIRPEVPVYGIPSTL